MNVQSHFLGLFLDNGNNEWSGGNVALFRVFDNVYALTGSGAD